MELMIPLWIACSVLAAFIVHAKGGSTLFGVALGLFLGPFGVLVAFFVGGQTCPACRSRIHSDATRCPRCQEAIAAEQGRQDGLKGERPT